LNFGKTLVEVNNGEGGYNEEEACKDVGHKGCGCNYMSKRGISWLLSTRRYIQSLTHGSSQKLVRSLVIAVLDTKVRYGGQTYGGEILRERVIWAAFKGTRAAELLTLTVS
jgi:hypothetical protein